MEGQDKGFQMKFNKLSNRRKFIRTLWVIPFAIIVLWLLQIILNQVVLTSIAAVLIALSTIIQAVVYFRKWRQEIMSEDLN